MPRQAGFRVQVLHMALSGFFWKKKKKHRTVPRTVQQSIPYTTVFADGTIETLPGTYTRAYRLEDVSFKIAPDEEQVAVFKAYGNLLNTFPPEVRFQVIIHNHSADRRKSFENIRYKPQKDGLNRYRREINNILIEKLSAGGNVTQDKYLVTAVDAETIEEGMEALSRIEKDVEKAVKKITREMGIKRLGAEERLHLLFEIYNQDGSSVFYTGTDEKGGPVFDYDSLGKAGLTTKDVIGPSGMEFFPGYFRLGETYGRALFIENVPNELSSEFMSDISEALPNMIISVHHTPIEMTKGIRLIRDHMLAINAQMYVSQQDAYRRKYSYDLISPELIQSQKQTRELLDDVIGNDQKLYYITFTVCLFAADRESLDADTKALQSIANKHFSPVLTLDFQQEQGLDTSLPLCLQQLFVKRMYTTQSASVYLPYTTLELYQKEGVYYGINKASGNLIMYSRTSAKYFNGLIFGEPGSGKSFMAKYEIVSTLLRDIGSKVYVIDPDGEYVKLAKALNGEVIDLAPGSQTYVNPLDMDIDYDGESNPVGMKTQYIISMIEIMLGQGRGITPEARTVVTRCCNTIYRPYIDHISKLKESGAGVTCDKAAMPTLNSLYNELLRQDEPEARTMATILENYAVGSFATFAHRSNVETEKRLVVYNIRNLGSGMKDLGLHVCINDVWNKMIENSKKGIWTRFYIDELHVLLQSDSATKYLVQVWKRARKWKGVPTGITQNTEDLIRTEDSRNIINNTSFVVMMSLASADRTNLGELLKIPETQMEYVTNAESGHGLLYTGKTTLPFANDFPKDTELYALLKTSEKDNQ